DPSIEEVSFCAESEEACEAWLDLYIEKRNLQEGIPAFESRLSSSSVNYASANRITDHIVETSTIVIGGTQAKLTYIVTKMPPGCCRATDARTKPKELWIQFSHSGFLFTAVIPTNWLQD